MENLPKPNQTRVVVFVALVTLIAGAAGAAGGVVSSRLSERLPVFGVPGAELSEAEIERKIVELIEEESATINVVERVTPAVASIVVRKRLKDLQREEFDLFDGYFFEQPEMTEEEANEFIEIGGGTGFFVTSDGLLVTNRHVVEDAEAAYSVITNDGEELPAEVVDTDPFFDIAIVRVQGSGFPVATLGDSDRVRIGQTVIAIGNTLSQYRNTVTKGVVSGIDRDVSAYDFAFGAELIKGAIQTDAAINPGNSGGPLINLLGEVIGVNTAISAEGEGVGFAIPINEVKQAVKDVEEVGRIVRPWLGVRFVMIDEAFAQENELSETHGALLVPGEFPDEPAVVPDSPAAAASLQVDDILLSIDGVDLTFEHSLAEAIRSHRPGDTVTITVKRGEETFDVEVTLAEFESN